MFVEYLQAIDLQVNLSGALRVWSALETNTRAYGVLAGTRDNQIIQIRSLTCVEGEKIGVIER